MRPCWDERQSRELRPGAECVHGGEETAAGQNRLALKLLPDNPEPSSGSYFKCPG